MNKNLWGPLFPLILSSGFLFVTMTAVPLPVLTSLSPFATSQQQTIIPAPVITTNLVELTQVLSPSVADELGYFMGGQTAWSDHCVPYRMEITGIGMGDRNNSINPQTYTLSNPTNVNWLLAQMAGRYGENAPTPDSMTFTTDAPESITLNEPTSNSQYGFTFEANLQPTDQVTASVINTGDSYKTPRGLILYAKRNTVDEKWASVGKTLNEFVYKNSYFEILTFPPLTETTDLFITAVVIDNDDDMRSLVLEATAGNVITQSEPITGPTNGPLLNIVPLTLNQVPAGTDQVTVTLQSAPDTGDSLVLVGLNASYICPGVDAPHFAYLPIIFKNYEPLICNPYFDDFSNSASGWQILDNQNAQLGYSAGEYFIFDKVSELRIVQAPTTFANKYAVEVNARWDSANMGYEYGLMFGQTSFPTPTYRFAIDPFNQKYRLRYNNGTTWQCVNGPAPCWVYSSFINSNFASNQLKVECSGATAAISLYVNNQLLWQGIGPSSCSGQVGLGTQAYPAPALAYFDNFQVSCPSAEINSLSNQNGSLSASSMSAGLGVDE